MLLFPTLVGLYWNTHSHTQTHRVCPCPCFKAMRGLRAVQRQLLLLTHARADTKLMSDLEILLKIKALELEEKTLQGRKEVLACSLGWPRSECWRIQKRTSRNVFAPVLWFSGRGVIWGTILCTFSVKSVSCKSPICKGKELKWGGTQFLWLNWPQQTKDLDWICKGLEWMHAKRMSCKSGLPQFESYPCHELTRWF